ncbi:hdmA [Escherichia coli 2362-75]|nr:hdmA [Escherichia coli 2362-75]
MVTLWGNYEGISQDPVIAEMNARLEAEFAAENEHTTQGD